MKLERPQRIKYCYSGKCEDVKQVLKQFTTSDILKRINIEAVRLLQQGTECSLPAARNVSYTIYRMPNHIPQKQDTIITAWGLVNLAYYAIMFSNDYRGKSIEKDEEFFMLYDAVEGMRQRSESAALDENNNTVRNLLYFWGFAGEQFKMEQIGKVFENAGRELYIMFESSTFVPEYQIDINEIVMKESGYAWQKILCALLLGAVFSTDGSDYQTELIHFANDSFLSEQEFLKIIEKYSCTYQMVRDSSLKRQIFYTKPYVKTQAGGLVSISPYLNFFLYEHCIFWIIRDYYLKKKDRDFTSRFGRYFEAYFEELLTDCLNPDELKRIPEGKTPRADWVLSIGEYRFLIEQKSTIMRLAAKQQESDIDSIEKFATDTVMKAMHQLQNTEIELNDGKYIKIILLYDDYMKSGFLDEIFAMQGCDITADGFFWLVSIEELELLLPLRKTNADLFNSIIAEKIRRELSHANNGSGLSQILHENGIFKNAYLDQEKFLKYKNLAQEESLILLGGKCRSASQILS